MKKYKLNIIGVDNVMLCRLLDFLHKNISNKCNLNYEGLKDDNNFYEKIKIYKYKSKTKFNLLEINKNYLMVNTFLNHELKEEITTSIKKWMLTL